MGGIVSLIGQVLTSGTGRNGRGTFGVISETGLRKGTEDRRRGTGGTTEGGTPYGTECVDRIPAPGHSHYVRHT